MSSLRARLEAFFFPEAPAERLAALRIATGAFVLWQIWSQREAFAAIARTPAALWSPVGPLVLLDGPLSMPVFDAWSVVNVALAVCFCLGLAHRLLAPLYAASLLCWFAYRTAWGGVLHAENLFCMHVICMALGPAASAWSMDAWLARRWPKRLRLLRWPELPRVDWRFGWNIRLICTITTLTYLLAGLAKVFANPGLAWAEGHHLLDQIGNDALYKELVSPGGAKAIVPWLYQHPAVLVVASTGTLILEVGAPFALLDRRLGWAWTVGVIGMHQGILRIMGIMFAYPTYGIAFLSFFPVETWVRWAIDRVPRRRVQAHEAA